MAEVFAGFVCGFGLSLLTAPVLAWRLVALRAESELVARIFPPETRLVPVALLVHFGLVIAFTGVGIILGLLLIALEDEAAALGSANGPFTLLVFGLVLTVAVPFVAVLAKERVVLASLTLLTLVVFGWLMPHMADWSKFD